MGEHVGSHVANVVRGHKVTAPHQGQRPGSFQHLYAGPGAGSQFEGGRLPGGLDHGVDILYQLILDRDLVHLLTE